MLGKKVKPRSVEGKSEDRGYALHGHWQAVARPEPGLYLVATPIGHLDDITLRALHILAGADLLACEDTRVTAKLLQRYGIRARATPFHEHNAKAEGPKLIKKLLDGACIALVSDAGTPLVSDPGLSLVQLALEDNVPVIPIPGASAVLTALTASGLPAQPFTFLGFLPPRAHARQAFLESIKYIETTLVLFETAPRLAASLADMAACFGPRAAALCRELTKKHETILRQPLDVLASQLAAQPVKGEIVLIIEGARGRAPAPDDITEELRAALVRYSLKDAVALVSAATGVSRKSVYAQALTLKPLS